MFRKPEEPPAEKPKKKASPKPPRANFLVKLVFQPWLLIVLATMVTLIWLVPMFVSWLPDLSPRDEFRMSTTDIRMTTPPPWVPNDILAQFIKSGELPETLSLLDSGLTRDVAETLERHPWIKKVSSVRKRRPADLFVELEYREPVAMIRVKSGLYPIDVDGILLPPHDFSMADAQKIPLVENIVTIPAGAAGVDWGDPIVTAAGACGWRVTTFLG